MVEDENRTSSGPKRINRHFGGRLALLRAWLFMVEDENGTSSGPKRINRRFGGRLALLRARPPAWLS